MKNMKKFLALMLALMLVLCLCACGGSGQGENPADDTAGNTENLQESTQESTEASIPEGMVQYKVKVVDDAGNPVVGVMIQICNDETCLIPVYTDETGVAQFAPTEEAEYYASILKGVPAGYEADADKFYFAEGETELTIQLKAV